MAITSYNEHKRPGKLERAIQIAFEDDRIGELVIRDDSGEGTEGLRYFKALTVKLRAAERRWFTLKLRWNSDNLGVFGAKLSAVRDAESEYVASLDSDNHIDKAYLDTLFSMRWLPHVMISPAHAMPEFDYTEKAGHKITLSNITDFLPWPRSTCMLNTGNQFFHRETMLKVFENASEKNFQLQQPDYFRAGDKLSDPKWRRVYDALDSFYFNKQWLLAGNEILIGKGLTYQHEVHAESSWQAAPKEKSVLPAIYAIELIDAASGVKSDYFVEGVGAASHVRPPLAVPGHTEVAVLRNANSRMWVQVAEPKVLRTVQI